MGCSNNSIQRTVTIKGHKEHRTVNLKGHREHRTVNRNGLQHQQHTKKSNHQRTQRAQNSKSQRTQRAQNSKSQWAAAPTAHQRTVTTKGHKDRHALRSFCQADKPCVPCNPKHLDGHRRGRTRQISTHGNLTHRALFKSGTPA